MTNNRFKTISVLILVKNEQDNIKHVLTNVIKKLYSLNIDFELVIVDGNSTDKTIDYVKEVLRDGDLIFIQQQPGYANALLEGIKKCNGKYILTLDGDCSHSADYIENLLREKEKYDLIIGSRFIKGGNAVFSFRHFLSIILNTIFRNITRVPIKDMSSGFRLYKREALKKAITDFPVFSVHFEVLIEIATKLYVKGYKISEIPICYKERREGSSKVILRKWYLAYLKALFKLFSLRCSAKSADYDCREFNSTN